MGLVGDGAGVLETGVTGTRTIVPRDDDRPTERVTAACLAAFARACATAASYFALAITYWRYAALYAAWRSSATWRATSASRYVRNCCAITA